MHSDRGVWLATEVRRHAAAWFAPDELASVRTFYRDAEATPLHRLPGLASELGLRELLIKDESSRFGLPAFKIVGARYAIARLIETTHTPIRTLAAATSGNHGRAVARAARDHGLEARIYVPAGTLPVRVEALRSESAIVIVTETDYDETVRIMARDAEREGWTIVSDTSWEGNERIPHWIMAGYSHILDEASRAWGDPPDVLVVQAGVGGLAAGMAGWLQARFGIDGPRLVIAEPEGSGCVRASLEAGRRVSLPACGPTAMAGLKCAEVSPAAWSFIAGVAAAAVAVPETLNLETLDRLAHPVAGDPAITAGPSGSCGLAALLRLMREPSMDAARRALGLGPHTRVMAIVTEGPTDRTIL